MKKLVITFDRSWERNLTTWTCVICSPLSGRYVLSILYLFFLSFFVFLLLFLLLALAALHSMDAHKYGPVKRRPNKWLFHKFISFSLWNFWPLACFHWKTPKIPWAASNAPLYFHSAFVISANFYFIQFFFSLFHFAGCFFWFCLRYINDWKSKCHTLLCACVCVFTSDFLWNMRLFWYIDTFFVKIFVKLMAFCSLFLWKMIC